ncbi:uncharacterized protein LOC136748732 isoform X2 [Amia ocellicauda]|uniref:uncharacterized protein LOC136748732 isoform X2 n=1 Tax=Amia ocellicauda TaxID=2972642 RepID=UPI0034644C0A
MLICKNLCHEIVHSIYSRTIGLRDCYCVCIPAVALSVALALQCLLCERHHSVQADCDDTVSLPCSATQNTKTYRSITWYRWYKMNNRSGILRKRKDIIMPFNFSRKAEFGPMEALILPNVRPEDSGKYQCFLSAELGSPNQESEITMTVQECVTQIVSTTITLPVEWTSSGPLVVQRNSSVHCGTHMTEVSAVLLVSGFTALGLVKAVLSFFFAAT